MLRATLILLVSAAILFSAGWLAHSLYVEEELGSVHRAMAVMKENNRVCMGTLEAAWKQGREIAASNARCREAMSRQYMGR